MEIFPPSLKIIRRNIDKDGFRTWIVYEDNKAGGGVFAKVVSFADIQTIVSTFPPEQYGSKLLQDSTLIMDETIYEKAGGSPTWSIKDLSLNLYQNFLSVSIIMGDLPSDAQTRIHLGKLTVSAGGLTWTLCPTSPINVPEQEKAYFVIPGVDKEINITVSSTNRHYCNGH